jgi:hypothetical protein
MAAPSTFGSNLPANFRNLAGASVANTDGGTYDTLPKYLQDLLVQSQAPSAATASASPASSSPAVVAPGASQQYATIEWRGLPGREAIPSMKGNLHPVYQLPIEQLNDFMSSGQGANYRANGTFAAGQNNAIPKAMYSHYTDPQTGETGGGLFSPDKDTEGNYLNFMTGNSLGSNTPGWTFNTGVAPPPATSVTNSTAQVNPVPQPAPQGNPYVTSQVPDAFKYAEGGLVEIGEQLREKGRMGDTMLAHISPDEARLLKTMGGSGTINPETGLPEYFSLGKIFKSLASAALPIVGNMIAPGIGGVLGGALGGGLNDGLQGAVLGGIGGGLGNLGGGSLGSLLGGGQQVYSSAVGPTQNQTGFAGLEANSSGIGGGGNSLGGLGNIKTLAALAATLAGHTDTAKQTQKLLQSQEAARQAKQDAESKDFQNRISSELQNQRQPVPVSSNYYTYGNAPAQKYFTDYKPIMAAKGGYIGEAGAGGGQDDTIPAKLSNNEYVIPADVVAHLGDGTPKQGAMKLDELITSVRKHKSGPGHPPKAKQIKQYVGGLGSGR